MYPLVIVKGATSPADFYERALAAFDNKQICEGAVDALQRLEENPAYVVVVEAELEDMSGVEVAEAIREIDAERGRFTYFILTGKAPSEQALDAFGEHIDAWATAGDAHKLNAVVRAGVRIAERINQLAEANEILKVEREGLIKGQLLDPFTGLGNRRYAEQALSDCVRQIESRGGAVCFLMIAVGNYEEVRETHNDRIAGELIVAVAKRLRHLVRPMDIVTYFAPGQFALVLLQPTIEQCTADCYKRIYDGVQLKSFSTAAGFLDARIGMSIAASLAETGAPHIETMIETAQSNLAEALQTRKIVVKHLNTE